MTVASFSMGDLQQVWNEGGRDAYFAAPAPILAGSAGSGTLKLRGGGTLRPGGKGQTMVKVTNSKGQSFLRRQLTNLENAATATKNKAGQIAAGTAGYASRGVESAGRGAVNTGGFVRDRANQLSGAIQKNPRIAGAVILGGTALGVGGGAYAVSRRGDN